MHITHYTLIMAYDEDGKPIPLPIPTLTPMYFPPNDQKVKGSNEPTADFWREHQQVKAANYPQFTTIDRQLLGRKWF